MKDDHRTFLVSAKAVICDREKVVLLKNSRGEWDLPGGKLQKNESIDEALRRELKEELAVELNSKHLLSANIHHFHPTIMVLVYGCEVSGIDTASISEEHSEVGFFPLADLPVDLIPAPYEAPIRSWLKSKLGPRR